MFAVMATKKSAVKVWFNQQYTVGSDITEGAEFGLASLDLEHDSPVLTCKFKRNNYFETAAKFIPNVLITFTEDCKAHLWIENFARVSPGAYANPRRTPWNFTSSRP